MINFNKFILSCFICLLVISSSVFADNLTVHQIDVGLGICAVAEAENGVKLMIDTGRSGSVDSVVQYLFANNLTTIDYLVVSHAHSDHYGGAAGFVSGGIEFLNVFDNGHVTNSSWVSPAEKNAYLNAVGSRLHTITAGWSVALGPSTTAQCLYVNGKYADGTTFDYDGVENNSSAVILISHGLYSHFFPADIYTDVEAGFAELPCPLSALTVAHHGLNTSTTQSFLDATLPEIGLLSVPDWPSFPSSNVIDRLESVGTYLYLTRRGGDPRGDVRTNIVINTDGVSSFIVEPDDEYFIPESCLFSFFILILLLKHGQNRTKMD